MMNLPLTTERLTLRALVEDDWPLFCYLYSDSEVMKHIREPQETVLLKEKFIERLQPWSHQKNGWLSLVIAENDENNQPQQSIGIIGLNVTNPDTRLAEVGFMLDIPHSGQGYSSEALACLVRYAFDTLNFHKLSASCSVDNIESQVVLEKNHFRKEGKLRHNSMVGEQFVDDWLYGLLIDD